MRRAPLAAVSLLACILIPRSARAQGESAAPLPAGTLRFSFGADWSHWTDRFSTFTALRPLVVDGAREPIGSYFGAESLGTQTLPFLAPIESRVRALAGLPGWLLNVGRATVTLDASSRSTPLRLEWAPSSRFGLSVNVPIVRARMSVFLNGPDTSIKSTLGNVGYNPAFLTAGALDAFRTQADTAMRALREQMASGPLALRAQAQALYNSLQPLACGLYTLAAGSASSATSPCYSASGIPQSPLLPTATSDAGDTLTAHLNQGQANYAALAAQYAAAGVAMPAFTSGYALPAPLDSAGVRRLFYDPRLLGGDSLTDVVRTRLGDVEVGGWLQLVNGPHWRSQVAVTARLATGSPDSPDNFVDLPTGTHERGVEIALRNDVIAGRYLWLHVGGRYGTSSADQLDRRITPWYLPYAPATALYTVQRKMGDYYGVDLVPNWQLDDAFGVAMGWHYFHQGATSYSLVANPYGGYPTPPYDPTAALGLNTEVTRMRVGVGLTFSTLGRYARGRARLPYRVVWTYNSTLYGRGGQVPKDGVMQLMVQAYINSPR